MADLEEALSLSATDKIPKAMMNKKNPFLRSTPTATTKPPPNPAPFLGRNRLLRGPETEMISQKATAVIGNMTNTEAIKEEKTEVPLPVATEEEQHVRAEGMKIGVTREEVTERGMIDIVEEAIKTPETTTDQRIDVARVIVMTTAAEKKDVTTTDEANAVNETTVATVENAVATVEKPEGKTMTGTTTGPGETQIEEMKAVLVATVVEQEAVDKMIKNRRKIPSKLYLENS